MDVLILCTKNADMIEILVVRYFNNLMHEMYAETRGWKNS